MKKIILSLIIPLTLFSQDDKKKEIEKKINYPNTIKWETNFLFESNGLNYSFLNDILYTGYITNDKKEQWINMGNKNNHLAFELANGLSYKNANLNLEFSILDKNILRASFTDDLMRFRTVWQL